MPDQGGRRIYVGGEGNRDRWAWVRGSPIVGQTQDRASTSNFSRFRTTLAEECGIYAVADESFDRENRLLISEAPARFRSSSVLRGRSAPTVPSRPFHAIGLDFTPCRQ